MRHAGIIDENIQAAELCADLGDHRAHLIIVLHVGLNGHRFHSGAFDLSGEILGFFVRTCDN